MALSIKPISDFFDSQNLKYEVDYQSQTIHLIMGLECSPDVQFYVHLSNATTIGFYTILPMKMPKHVRAQVAEYFNRVNSSILVGTFYIDMDEGRISFKATGIFDENMGIPTSTIRTLTFIGFNMFEAYVPGMFAILYGGKTAQQAFDDVCSQQNS